MRFRKPRFLIAAVFSTLAMLSGYSNAQGGGHVAEAARKPSALGAPAVLPAGAEIKVRTASAVSTNSHRAGDRFYASLMEPLKAGDQVIAEKGARVEGILADADKGGRIRGRARIALRLTKLTLPGGSEVDLHTARVVRWAPRTRRRDLTRIGITTGAGATIGAIAGGGLGAALGAVGGAGAGGGYVLATRGAPARVPGESVVRFRLTAPVRVPGAAAKKRSPAHGGTQ